MTGVHLSGESAIADNKQSRLNEDITAPEVRLIAEDGEQKGIVSLEEAQRLAVEAGRLGYEAGVMKEREFASPSTPTIGTPFWHQFN